MKNNIFQIGLDLISVSFVLAFLAQLGYEVEIIEHRVKANWYFCVVTLLYIFSSVQLNYLFLNWH